MKGKESKKKKQGVANAEKMNRGFLEGRWGRGGAEWVPGSKEGTCWDERWVSFVSDASLGSTPEIDTTLCVN